MIDPRPCSPTVHVFDFCVGWLSDLRASRICVFFVLDRSSRPHQFRSYTTTCPYSVITYRLYWALPRSAHSSLLAVSCLLWTAFCLVGLVHDIQFSSLYSSGANVTTIWPLIVRVGHRDVIDLFEYRRTWLALMSDLGHSFLYSDNVAGRGIVS